MAYSFLVPPLAGFPRPRPVLGRLFIAILGVRGLPGLPAACSGVPFYCHPQGLGSPWASRGLFWGALLQPSSGFRVSLGFPRPVLGCLLYCHPPGLRSPWADLGKSGPIWVVLGCSGPIWADLGWSGPVRAALAGVGQGGLQMIRGPRQHEDTELDFAHARPF